MRNKVKIKCHINIKNVFPELYVFPINEKHSTIHKSSMCQWEKPFSSDMKDFSLNNEESMHSPRTCKEFCVCLTLYCSTCSTHWDLFLSSLISHLLCITCQGTKLMDLAEYSSEENSQGNNTEVDISVKYKKSWDQISLIIFKY